MISQSPVGGFFELEISSGGDGYHPEALALTNGRACMNWVLSHKKPCKVYVPFYTCYALFEPMEKLGIPYEFYDIDDQLNPVDLPDLKKNELFVFINFYGLKNKNIPDFISRYGENLIIDNTHSFFNKGYKDIISFTSARKYFGVPDGAYLYCLGGNTHNDSIPRFTNVSVNHNVKRLIGNQEEAYADYLKYEDSLGHKINRISLLSEILLSNINYEKASQKRIENFIYLHTELNKINELEIDINQMDVPFCYPFLPSKVIDKTLFYKNNIFVPILWPDVLERENKGYELEKNITQRILPLPIDQRYGKKEMNRIINIVQKLT